MTFQILPEFPSLSKSTAPSPVRLGIHDASRAEWSVVLPLPLAGPLSYSIEVEFTIPSQAFVRHSPWDHLQTFARLDGGSAGELRQNAVTIDALRRTVLAHAQRLSRESEAFARTCRLAASLVVPGAVAPLDLRSSIEAAATWMGQARDELLEPVAGEPVALRRERRLADEYLSVRLLEFLAGVERSLVAASSSRAPQAELLAPVVQEAESAAAALLEIELAHRQEARYVCADPDSLAAQERYLERASQLKKHFQEVLFLEAEHVKVVDRIQHAVAGVAGLLAAAVAFALQFWVTARAANAERIGSSLIFLMLIAGLSYVFRDRFKEIGRVWIAGRVRRLYAERIARFRAPARRLATRDIVASAKESFQEACSEAIDSLNPEAGARRAVTVLRYRHRGTVMPQAQLAASGVERVKQTFRYDLSPMFSRLDDAVKEIPVLDAAARRVRFVEAPRCYRVPMHVEVSIGREHYVEEATLVMHKRGLDRIELGPQHEEPMRGDELLDDVELAHTAAE